MELLKEILKSHKIKDTERKVRPILNRIKTEIETENINAEVVLGGSVAKGTHLKKYDCDIFVKFGETYKDKNLSELLEKILQCFDNVERVHGSRDYFKLLYQHIEFEIVPVLNIKNSEEALNVTDVSPLHVLWVKKHIGKKADDIKLAKLFCKAQRVYGAESFINGFSGYMIEILVIYYGSFLNFLKGVSNWKLKEVIDFTQYYKNEKEVFKTLNKAKLDSPLILIDPVQKERNAAAALSYEKFNLLIAAAAKFLAGPSKKMFCMHKFLLKKIKIKAKKEKGVLIMIEAAPLEGKKDVIGGKLLKCFNYGKRQLELNDFKLLDSDWYWSDIKQNAYMWYIVHPEKLSEYKIHAGPLISSNKKDVAKFIKKHKKYKIENNRIYSEMKRKYTKPKQLIKNLMNIYFNDKVKKQRLIE